MLKFMLITVVMFIVAVFLTHDWKRKKEKKN